MQSSQAFVSASEDEKISALQQLWPSVTKQQYQDENWRRFIQYMDLELEKLRDNHSLFSIEDRSQAIQIIELLRLNSSHSREKLSIMAMSRTPQELGAVHRSLELAARLWLTINIDSFHLTSYTVRGHARALVWQDGDSLREAISSHFEPKPAPIYEGRIRPILTMAYLETRHGFQVRWTHNLAEHLSIDWKYRTVTVYEHLICLWNHLEAGTTVIPKSILEEAIDTINLLFPSEKKETQDYLRKHGRTFWKLGYCKGKRDLGVGRYLHWQDSVQQLMDIIGEPKTGLQQFRLDKERKNTLEFATFWTATVVALLTIVSIIFGTAATVYTIKQYNVAVKAYNLQRAQACMTSGASLPQYCS